MAYPDDNRAAPLPCCVEAPASYLPRAQYGLRMLLLPLGIDPRWVKREDLTGQGLYYGPEPDGFPEGVLRLRLAPATIAYFDAATPYDRRRVHWRTWDEDRWPILFHEAGTDDLVASTFFWLSGWQEHTTRERDQHGRFPHHASLQAHLGTTTRPGVEAYRAMFAERLMGLGVPLRRRAWGGAAWALCPTFDIDYLRKWRKGMVFREAVEYFLLNRRRARPGARLRRFGHFLRDWMAPGDVYRMAFERLEQETIQHGGTGTFFLKTDAHGPHDVFYAPDDPYLQRRVTSLKDHGFEIGLHPSYYAHAHPEYQVDERDRLRTLVTQPSVSVRQHFLRYDVPATPRLHQAAGFQIDSSLGFAEHEGFRHATCLPFQLFDPLANAPIDLWEMPLAVMDGVLFNRRGMDPEAARRATEDILETCRRFGGVAVMLWHNVLWDEMDHPGWGRHFVETLDEAVARGARVTSLKDALAAWMGETGGR